MRFLLLHFLFLSQVFAVAKGDDFLYTYTIKGSIEQNKKTFYSTFIETFAKNSSGQTVKSYPYKRSIHYFIKDKNSCLFPASKELFEKNSKDYIFSSSLVGVDINLVSLVGSAKAKSIESIREKVVVTLNQTFIPEKVKEMALNVIEVESEDQAIKMLRSKRANFLLASGFDIVSSFKQEGVRLEYEPSLVVDTFYDRIVCHKNKKNAKRVETFNKMIR